VKLLWKVKAWLPATLLVGVDGGEVDLVAVREAGDGI
jgi:hypothetical protein